MGQSPGDDKHEPSLELPSLSLRGLARRKRKTPSTGTSDAPPAAGDEPATGTTAEEPAAEDPTLADVPRGEPTTGPDEETTALPVDTGTDARAGHEVEVGPGLRAGRSGAGISLPVLPGRLAAAVTGLVVGGAGAAATYAAMAGCEAVRGVSTCGEAPGFFILVAILALMVLLGTVVLTTLQVGDTASTSFLAVGIVTVVVMLVLLDVIFSPWMFVVIPLLGAGAFVLSHWVTHQFGEETGRPDWS